MKFKYKKIIILITMCTMCIGLVTISLSVPGGQQKKQIVSDSEISVKNEKEEDLKQNSNNNSKTVEDKKETSDNIKENKSTKEPASAEEENGLKANENEKINELIKNYLDASLTCDKDALGKVVIDVENVDMSELEAKKKLVEEYQNVECYTLDGEEAGEYLVYVYSELKFADVDTAAPGLMRLYVKTDEDGEVKIQIGSQTQEIKEWIAKADESEEVKKIINTVNYKLEEAISKDSALRDFYSKLNGGSDEVDNAGQDTANRVTVTPTDEQ